MATYLELQTDVINLINRTDCTNTLAKTFLTQAHRKIIRTLRLPSLEATLEMTAGDNTSTVYNSTTGEIVIPSDFIELIYMHTNKNIIERVPLRRYIELTERVSASGNPRYYTRINAGFMTKPIANTGTVITLLYAKDDTTLTSDSSTNILSTVCPDLLLYGSLIYAADYFKDERRPQFEGMYNQIYAEVKELAATVDAATADSAIQPSFVFEEDLLN